MDAGSVDTREFRALLVKGLPAFVKVVMAREGSRWILQFLEAVVGRQPPGWRPSVWEYDDLAFVAQQATADVVADAFHESEAQILSLSRYQASVTPVQAQVNFRRQPSRVRFITPPLPWPVCDYQVHRRKGDRRPRQDSLLVGEGPSFPNFDTAFRAFLTGDYSTVGAGPMFTELGRVRLVQSDAWFHRVRVAPTHLDIQVAGEAAEGARIEVIGSGLQVEKRVGRTGRVRMRFPHSLPRDAWLYLSRDGHWMDYRAFGTPILGREDGIELELPEDPESRIQALLAQGEGPQIEYKRSLPGTRIEEKRRMLKTLAAFANGEGGSIVFGMDPDEVTLVGLKDISLVETRDRLDSMIQGSVVPPNPAYQLHSASIDQKLVLLLEVGMSSGRPFGLQFQDKPVEFYVRRGASTFAATQEEVRNLSLADPATGVSSRRGRPSR